MPKIFRCIVFAYLLATACSLSHGQAAIPPSPTVHSVSLWPTTDLLKHNEKAEVTTFDMPGVPFPCKVQSLTADQLVCGKARGRQMAAFDRQSVQSVAVAGHARHKASLILFSSAAGLLVGGLACAAASGEGKVCGGVLITAVAALVSGQVAEHSERYMGPTDARTIYIAPTKAQTAPNAVQHSTGFVETPLAKEDKPVLSSIE